MQIIITASYLALLLIASGFLLFSLQEKAPKWVSSRNSKQAIDGLTTNGVLIMQPRNGFTHQSEATHWKEVSVCGGIYSLRESRSAQNPGSRVRTIHDVAPLNRVPRVGLANYELMT